MPLQPFLSAPKPPRDTLLAIGVFDGVHLGHQHLLEELKSRARQRGLMSLAVTFREHPRSVLFPERQVNFLATLEERVRLLQGLGLDQVLVLPFTREVAQLTAREFVVLLQEHLRMRGLVAGRGFALGRGREGDLERLAILGRELAFTVDEVAPRQMSGEVVSSTAIRLALAQGDIPKVRAFLGRPYTLQGPVVEGDRRGRLLGFPTANIAVPEGLALPLDGGYLTWAVVQNRLYKSVTNIGVRPTFGVLSRTVEVHIIDFNGDLYGQELRIELRRRFRPEIRFPNIEELQAQISRDVTEARELLALEERG